jgi:spore maturation protein CgeB
MSPAVFGNKMLQCLANSRVVLNVHADSSPWYASNMRLFETTGVGTLLLTEWRKNISELFEPNQEVVTFSTVEECIEKARWFLDHPAECAHVAHEGQKRTLRDHTFDIRAEQFCAIMNKHL